SQDVPSYVEGLIAFYERRYGDAIAHARAAFQSAGWLYEALELEGDADLGLALLKRGDPPAASALYEAAGRVYARALDIARSDDNLYFAECRRLTAKIGLQVDSGDFASALISPAAAACDKALAANSENTDALEGKVQLYSWLLNSEDTRKL